MLEIVERCAGERTANVSDKARYIIALCALRVGVSMVHLDVDQQNVENELNT